MNDIRNGMNKIFNASIVTSVIIFVLGLFLFIQPDTIINMISVILGIIILIPGITSLVDYFRYKNQSSLVVGIVTVIIGGILIFNTTLVASILPFILGIYFVINGINRLQYALSLKKQRVSNSLPSIIISILIIVCGILFIVNPFGGAMVITQVMGIFMIVYSILDICNSAVVKKEMNDLNKSIIEIEVSEKND